LNHERSKEDEGSEMVITKVSAAINQTNGRSVFYRRCLREMNRRRHGRRLGGSGSPHIQGEVGVFGLQRGELGEKVGGALPSTEREGDRWEIWEDG